MSDEAEAYLEGTIDKLIEALDRLTNELERYNDNKSMEEGGAK